MLKVIGTRQRYIFHHSVDGKTEFIGDSMIRLLYLAQSEKFLRVKRKSKDWALCISKMTHLAYHHHSMVCLLLSQLLNGDSQNNFHCGHRVYFPSPPSFLQTISTFLSKKVLWEDNSRFDAAAALHDSEGNPVF